MKVLPTAEKTPCVHMAEQQHEGPGPEQQWPTLEALRVWYMRRVMDRAGNQKGRAARMLGVDRRTLNRWLREAGDVEARASALPRPPRAEARASPRPGADQGDWRDLSALRLEYIHRVVEHTRNKTRAAEILGIDRRTLNRILTRERVRAGGAAG